MHLLFVKRFVQEANQKKNMSTKIQKENGSVVPEMTLHILCKSKMYLI